MIKFRGKRIDNGEWVEGYYWYNCLEDEYQITVSEHGADNFMNYTVEPDSIGMFTTLLDKNKKEIYGSIEINGKMSKGGDVVKYNTYDGYIGTSNVEFKNGYFYPVAKVELYNHYDGNGFEILSPIYEKEQTDNPRIIDDGYPFTNLKPTYEKGEK